MDATCSLRPAVPHMLTEILHLQILRCLVSSTNCFTRGWQSATGRRGGGGSHRCDLWPKINLKKWKETTYISLAKLKATAKLQFKGKQAATWCRNTTPRWVSPLSFYIDLIHWLMEKTLVGEGLQIPLRALDDCLRDALPHVWHDPHHQGGPPQNWQMLGMSHISQTGNNHRGGRRQCRRQCADGGPQGQAQRGSTVSPQEDDGRRVPPVQATKHERSPRSGAQNRGLEWELWHESWDQRVLCLQVPLYLILIHFFLCYSEFYANKMKWNLKF